MQEIVRGVRMNANAAFHMALLATVEITPIAAATVPKGPRMFLREFMICYVSTVSGEHILS